MLRSLTRLALRCRPSTSAIYFTQPQVRSYVAVKPHEPRGESLLSNFDELSYSLIASSIFPICLKFIEKLEKICHPTVSINDENAYSIVAASGAFGRWTSSSGLFEVTSRQNYKYHFDFF